MLRIYWIGKNRNKFLSKDVRTDKHFFCKIALNQQSMFWDKFMMPCLSKQLFGLDCPGCGMQRSAALVLEGHFESALHMFPAIYTTIVLFALIGVNVVFKKSLSRIIIPIAILNGIIMLASFLYKIFYLTQ